MHSRCTRRRPSHLPPANCTPLNVGSPVRLEPTSVHGPQSRHGADLTHCAADRHGDKGVQPGLQEALETIERGYPQALVVAKLDRLSRSLLDFASLMERGRRRGRSLVALDLGVAPQLRGR